MRFALCAIIATTLASISLTTGTAQVPRDGNARQQAPIGHRQPRPQDLPPSVRQHEGGVSPRQRDFDQQLYICRGC
jgi:hypothetical protein